MKKAEANSEGAVQHPDSLLCQRSYLLWVHLRVFWIYCLNNLLCKLQVKYFMNTKHTITKRPMLAKAEHQTLALANKSADQHILHTYKTSNHL